MGVMKKYTDQIVVMNTQDQGAEIRALAEEFGESVSEVARVAQMYGLPRVAEHFRKVKGIRHLPRKGAGNGAKAPEAEFSSPA